MTKTAFNWLTKIAPVAMALMATVSCAGDVPLSSRSPATLLIELLQGASGANPAAIFETRLNSDVITLVRKTDPSGTTTLVPTVFSDPGRVQLRVILKNFGNPDSPSTPSHLAYITVTHYRVKYRRTDGRNREGIDVPYAVEGGMTATVGVSSVTVIFDLVRHSTKEEPPLSNLVNHGGAGIINTIADVTFFGRDQNGNNVSVTGSISVNFGDFGDPS
jgi:hypothetical protein